MKLQYDQIRTTTINRKEGLSALNIASLSPDYVATKEMQNDIIQQLPFKMVHIATIQETHIPQNCTFKKQNYAIITSGAIHTGICRHTHRTGTTSGRGSNINTSGSCTT